MENFRDMKDFKMLVLAILLVLVMALTDARKCKAGSLAKYNITFNTFWSKAEFPKQYPLFRPPASWSSLVGKLPWIRSNFCKLFNNFEKLKLSINMCGQAILMFY